MLPWIQHRWTNLGLLFMGLGALMLFLYGFFPLKYNSGKFASKDQLPNFIGNISVDGQQTYKIPQHSVVLMIIDGLRYDFVTKEYMPYAAQLLEEKQACLHVAVAEPPTVTMPRIKSPERKKEKAQWRRTINFWRDIYAMMTGTVSTFADVALNFGAPAVQGDSILRVAREQHRRTVLYGDDTWLRLFPGLWNEADGTTSFYVTDYTEVDNNVTRHLDDIFAANVEENHRSKFDFLVLHYLGLDHIGHLEGARSPKIKPKLLEMDEIVKKIMTAMRQWSGTGVLFVCGDHGMRDAGGHGGSSPAEVLVPLLVTKTKNFECPYPNGQGNTVAQVDLAPTIAWLLQTALPYDSAGRILPALMPDDLQQHLYLLHVNALNLARNPHLPKDREFYQQYKRAQTNYATYLISNSKTSAKLAKEFYEESIESMSKYLTETTAEFDLFVLGIGIISLYLICAALFWITLYSMQPENDRPTSTRHYMSILIAFLIMLVIISGIMLLSCFITETKSKFCSFDPIWSLIFILTACSITASYFLIKTGMEKTRDLSMFKEFNVIDYLLIGGTLFHPWSFFGTSFIEEEHMTWYFFWNTLMFFVLIRTLVVVVMYFTNKYLGATEVQEKPSLEQKISTVSIKIVPMWILLIALHRYLRTMNQTGDRWLFLPDTADWLNAPDNEVYLLIHFVVGLVVTTLICIRHIKTHMNIRLPGMVLTIISFGCIICCRLATVSFHIPVGIRELLNTVYITNIFWLSLICHFVLEILSYSGILSACGKYPVYSQFMTKYKDQLLPKPKAKYDDYLILPLEEAPWLTDDVKLNMSRSLSYLMLNSLMLTVSLLMRSHNVIMVPSVYLTCVITNKCLDHKLLDARPLRKTDVVDDLSKVLAHIWIGTLFFFYQGNSNSLASVDLAAGYVGLHEYCPLRVAARMGLHTYAGPTLAGAALYCQLAERAVSWKQYLESVWRVTNVLAFHRVYCVVIYCLVATIFRHHLFVWSVFSPKLLYDFVTTVFTVQAVLTIAEIIFITCTTCWIARRVMLKSKWMDMS